MNFRASFCDPLNPDVLELGNIQKDMVIRKFESIRWKDFLEKMDNAREDEIFYSPSLEVENVGTNHALTISAVGSSQSYEFYIFYKRPKMIKTFFGLKEKIIEDYLTDKTNQTKQDVLECLNALLENKTDFLAQKIGE